MRGYLGLARGVGLLILGFMLIGPLLDIRSVAPPESTLPGGGPVVWLRPPPAQAQMQAAIGVAVALAGAVATVWGWRILPIWKGKAPYLLSLLLTFPLGAAVIWVLWVGLNLASSAIGWTHREVEEVVFAALATFCAAAAVWVAFGFVQTIVIVVEAYRSGKKRPPGFSLHLMITSLMWSSAVGCCFLFALLFGFRALPAGPLRHAVFSTVATTPGIRGLVCEADDPQAAIAACTALIQSGYGPAAKLSEVYNDLGAACDGAGQADQAIADYSRAIALDPRDALAFENRGQLYGDKGLYDQAIADYSQAVRIVPRNARAYVGRGDAYAAKSAYDDAIADYSRAIELAPEYAAPYNERAWTRHLQGKDAQGVADAEQAVGLAPRNAYAIETRAEIYEKLGRRAQAVADYRAALDLKPDMKDAQDGLKRLGAAPSASRGEIRAA